VAALIEAAHEERQGATTEDDGEGSHDAKEEGLPTDAAREGSVRCHGDADGTELGLPGGSYEAGEIVVRDGFLGADDNAQLGIGLVLVLEEFLKCSDGR
jgi:hypothetical protein